MTEEIHDVRLSVNGSLHSVRVPARRLLSDALRHDLGLTGTHVGCEHGVCGACTVLVDGRPTRSCLMFAVSAVDAEITTVEGLTNADGSLGPVQQAFKECHGLQCGFCTPGFLTTITAGLRENPQPTRDEAREMIGGNLCRCTGYQNIVKAVERAAEIGGFETVAAQPPQPPTEAAAQPPRPDGGGCCATSSNPETDGGRSLMTTKLMGSGVQRVEDDRFLRGHGRYVDDIAVGTTLHAAVLRSPHAHAKITGIDVDEVLDLEGVHAVWTHEDLTGPMAEPLPLLIPHPALTHGRTQYALAKDEVNYVGEAIAFVVAADRYLAEDAVDRIRVSYDVLPPVVGLAAARAADRLVHEDVPGNIGARLEQENGDARAAIASAPHTLSLDLTIERSACMPMEGRGTVARWDPDVGRMTVWSSTQTSTGVRAAVAVKLGLDLGQVDVITPDVGGGFGVKINHPWPEELLVPMAARALGRPVKFTEDRREHFISSAHERGQVHHVDVGFDDEGRLLGLDVEFWHDHGAYSPYGLIVSIITSTQLLGPYKPQSYRVVFESLYTNTVMVTPYRGAGRPQGCYVMERTMDAIADHLGRDRADVRSANFIQPDEFPFDQGLVFQDGRELEYDSGDYPASLVKLKELVGWDEFPQFQQEMAAQGRRVGIGLACYVEGTGVGPYEGAHVAHRDLGQGQGGHRPDHPGPRAREPCSRSWSPTSSAAGSRTSRWSPATPGGCRTPWAPCASRAAVMSGSAIDLAAKRAKEKVLPDRGRGAGGRRGRPRDRRRRGVGEGDRHLDRPGDGLGALEPVALRVRRGVQGGHPVQRRRPRQAPGGRGRRARPGGARLLLTRAGDLRLRHARGDRGDRPGDRRDHHLEVRRGPRLRPPDQPDDRRGPDPRRRRAGGGRCALRADGLRRGGPAAERVLHGLPDALRQRGAGVHRHRPPRDAVAAQPTRHQGRRRGRRHPVRGGVRRRHRGRRGPDHPGLRIRAMPISPSDLFELRRTFESSAGESPQQPSQDHRQETR